MNAPTDGRRDPKAAPPDTVQAAQPDDHERRADAALYVDIMFGDDTGYACVATGRDPYLSEKGKYTFPKRGWNEFSLRWPEQRDDLINAIVGAADARVDLYVCSYLRTSPDRSKGNVVRRDRIHADIDGELSAEKVKAVGGFAVDSGTEGHGHVYLALSTPVDVRQHEALCRALGRYLGHADAKVSDNDVLRPPGSVNRKPTVRGVAASPVRWLVKP
jgi:hypothetical protein